jgi:hypothetical protein
LFSGTTGIFLGEAIPSIGIGVPVPPPHAEMKTESSSKRKSEGSFDNTLIIHLKNIN